MHTIELIPDSLNCIETVARKEYKNLTDSLLRNGEYSDDFKNKFELLRTFLEHSDFRKLRKESDAYLLKGQRIKFIIFQEQGRIKYKITPIQ